MSTTKTKVLFAILGISLLLTSLLLADEPRPGSDSPLIIPGSSFAADGADSGNYTKSAGRINGGPSVEVYAGVYLPPNTRITSVELVARDATDSFNVTVYLKETPFGTLGGTTNLYTLQTAGNSTSIQRIFNFADALVDPQNNLYYLVANLPHADLRIYQFRIFYEQAVIFADGFESGDTSAWSSASPLAPQQEKGVILDPVIATTQFWVNDPVFMEALDNSLNLRAGYGSPLVIPGPAFKTHGGADAGDYYMSSPYGYLYTRPDETAFFDTPVNLPQGANISFVMVAYIDSNPDAKIMFWLSRVATLTGVMSDLGFLESSGIDGDIRFMTLTAGDLVDPVIDNGFYSYFLNLSVEETDWGASEYNRVYAVIILYTLP